MSDRSIVDNQYMQAALSLARRGLGSVWPNPAVGCVLVDDSDSAAPVVVGRGWTQPGGRPHAESEALARAGVRAKGAIAYVSLEPCAHYGQTPPCADAMVEAGIGRVVVALQDPDPRVSGRGLARLRRAGIPVEVGLGAAEASEVNAGFLSRIVRGRPLVAVKTASSLDGRIAAAGGAGRWITGEAARAHAHRLRASFDAVLIGVGTAAADDPRLTCRLPGLADRSPVRVVLDSTLSLSGQSQLVRTAREHPLWIVVTPSAIAERRKAMTNAGAKVVEVPADGAGRCDLPETLAALARLGLTRVLVEGGGTLAGALLQGGLIDRLIWFRAPTTMGADALPAFGALGLASPDEAYRFVRVAQYPAGRDWIETYVVQERPCSPAS